MRTTPEIGEIDMPAQTPDFVAANDTRPRHLIADLDDLVQHPGGMRLAQFLLADGDAGGAYWTQIADAYSIGRASAPAPVLPAALGQIDINTALGEAADRMSGASLTERRAITDHIVQIYPARSRQGERNRRIRHLGRLVKDAHPEIKTIRDMARRLYKMIAGRDRAHPKSTGSVAQDKLIDEIIACGPIPHDRTIRNCLAD